MNKNSVNETTDIYTNAESGYSSKFTTANSNKTITVNPPKICSGNSDYNDVLLTQQLRLDFTPDEEIDNDYAQNKCCKFWDFINSIPEIQHLKEKIPKFSESVTSENTSEVSTSETRGTTSESREKTALSVLEFADDKGLINRLFEAKIPRSQCTLGSREYKAVDNNLIHKKKSQTGRCRRCIHPENPNTPGPCPCNSMSTPLKELVSSMEDWDSKHPKSMQPPGHAPSLQHGILQRKGIL